MTNKEVILCLKYIKSHRADPDSAEPFAFDLAIKALEKIDDVKNHKFLSPDYPNYFGKLPEITKGYQKGWNDALDALVNDFIYEEKENDNL